jgi:hypothetical protein
MAVMRETLAKIYFPAVREKPRRFEVLLLLFWAGVTLRFSEMVIAAKLFLICIYGWTRTHGQGLAILAMPKGHPWPVSNGDFIPQRQHFLHFLITVVCWIVLFYVTYLPIRRILPRQNDPATA